MRRPLQFGIPALLALTLLVAAVLGLYRTPDGRIVLQLLVGMGVVVAIYLVGAVISQQFDHEGQHRWMITGGLLAWLVVAMLLCGGALR
jgi:hypothetical protein